MAAHHARRGARHEQPLHLVLQRQEGGRARHLGLCQDGQALVRRYRLSARTHLRAANPAHLGRRQEARIIQATLILHRDGDPITSTSAQPEVVFLEVEVRLGEPILVGDVVHGVGDDEGVGARKVEVGLGGGREVCIEVEVEFEVVAVLIGYLSLGTLEGDDVVATGERLLDERGMCCKGLTQCWW